MVHSRALALTLLFLRSINLAAASSVSLSSDDRRIQVPDMFYHLHGDDGETQFDKNDFLIEDLEICDSVCIRYDSCEYIRLGTSKVRSPIHTQAYRRNNKYYNKLTSYAKNISGQYVYYNISLVK